MSNISNYVGLDIADTYHTIPMGPLPCGVEKFVVVRRSEVPKNARVCLVCFPPNPRQESEHKSLIPRTPRPIASVTDEYRRALEDLADRMPEDPHENLDGVAKWLAGHNWRPTDFTDRQLGLIGEVLSAVHLDMTLLLIEETPEDENTTPAAAEEGRADAAEIELAETQRLLAWTLARATVIQEENERLRAELAEAREAGRRVELAALIRVFESQLEYDLSEDGQAAIKVDNLGYTDAVETIIGTLRLCLDDPAPSIETATR